MTQFEDLVRNNRSCRRFHQNHRIEVKTLKSLVNLARLSASGANLQPLKYILACNSEINERIFSCLAWAAYLKDWNGPEEGERPSAYIVILGDTEISKTFGCDHGIAAQSILLGARANGLAGCMIGSVKRKKLQEILEIKSRFEILLVIAIGEPKEKARLEAVGPDGNIKYWHDNDKIHHVPKRNLNELIIESIE